MSNEDLPPDEANVKELNSQLQDGIQSCRSVISNYRNLLSGNDGSSNDDEPEEGANLSGTDEREADGSPAHNTHTIDQHDRSRELRLIGPFKLQPEFAGVAREFVGVV